MLTNIKCRRPHLQRFRTFIVRCSQPEPSEGTTLMVRGKPTYLWAAEAVLRKHRRPLHAPDIVSYAQEQGLFSEEMHSRTPQKSMQARLSLDILKKGERSVFVRTGRGAFYLRELLADNTPIQLADELNVGKSTSPRAYTAPRRAPMLATERVLAIPRSHYEPLLTFQGLECDNGALVRDLVNGPVRHVARTEAESTDDYKQVVTYVLVTHGAKVLSFRRGTFNRAAAFLRGSLCIGFGGHVAQSDLSIFSFADAGVRANAVRELCEEVVVPGLQQEPQPEDLRIVGVINDDATEVGRRHVGIVMRYELRDPDWTFWERAQRGEASINQLRWIDALGEAVNIVDFEYWSQLCWRTLFPVMVKAQPIYRILRKKPFRGTHVLVVVGGIGSGKSSATKYLTRNFGYVEVNSGRVLADLLALAPVPETPRPLFQEAAWRFIEQPEGPAQLADALWRAILRSKADRVVIDGVRQLSTLRALKAITQVPVAVLFVHAAPDLAFDLFISRGRHRGDNPIGSDAFMRMLSAPVEQDVPLMIPEADAVIYNWSGEANYARTLSAMAEELGLRRGLKKGA
jgi:predicted NUDIX family phosphoesterase